jgi:hypothetical protein
MLNSREDFRQIPKIQCFLGNLLRYDFEYCHNQFIMVTIEGSYIAL